MEVFNSLISGDFIGILAKVFFLTCSFLFTIFLLVVFRQVISLDKLVSDENDSVVLKFIAFILLVSSVSLFLIALVIL